MLVSKVDPPTPSRSSFTPASRSPRSKPCPTTPPTPVAHPVCRGRVSDLSAHVPPRWWRGVFGDHMYLKTDGDVVEDPDVTREEIRMLEDDSLLLEVFRRGEGDPSKPPSRILDLCCGQGRHTLFLAREYPHLHIHGHDQSTYLINLARERSTHTGSTQNTRFTVGDSRRIPYPDSSFDLVLVMGNSFGYHAEDEEDVRVLEEIYRAMAPGGRGVLDLTDGEHMRCSFAERSWEWVDDATFVCRERQLSADGKRLISREVITAVGKGVVRDQFYQERLYSRDEIEDLVRKTGFVITTEEETRRKSQSPTPLVEAEEVHLTSGVPQFSATLHPAPASNDSEDERTSKTARDSDSGIVERGDAGVVTVAKELSKRQEDLGMMERRILVKFYKRDELGEHQRIEPEIDENGSWKMLRSITKERSVFDSEVQNEEFAWDEEENEVGVKRLSSGENTNLHSHVPVHVDDPPSSPDTAFGDRTISLATPAAVESGQEESPMSQPTTSTSAFHTVDNYPNSESLAVSLPLISSALDLKSSISCLTLVLGDPNRPCFGKLNNTWNAEDMETRRKLLEGLDLLGFSESAGNLVIQSDHHRLLLDWANVTKSARPKFVLNLCDEGLDNDATKELHVPALLEMLNIPYTGAGPNCLAHCYDKGLVNRTAKTLNVPIPREVYYFAAEEGDTPNSSAQKGVVADVDGLHEMVLERVGYPAFVKPVKGDNSLGITTRSIVRDKTDLEAYMKELAAWGIRDVIVQEYLQGTEYGVGMVGNAEAGFHFFPTMEVDYSKIVERNLPPILGYESKWDPNSPYWSEIKYRPAQLHPDVERLLRKHCVMLWERFGCVDYARFDFRCDVGKGDGYDGLGGNIKLLEVNPNPGWCWDDYYNGLEALERFEGDCD
ncbi:hypothetical protein M427DRAFT_42284 [Gonapodya prolifera JEL478]|uniref:ATP-grasp domain-containing protein n=1 Tax=Gonapodya prolifera (strain JEL478) TaxID=1344416 RepID=A0A139APY0_GONPJ|nr:hypothetical protein M427DRAFT_42284 [Gonapodya prolifera JEL478]|eukprot:KXS18563.1 hypothetical protein M427DRAFT_42284 [Gonapodya prolifera JEL478]